MKVGTSALKHGISELDILFAAENWAYASQPDDDIPAKQFVLGFDPNGRLLELAILTFDSGQQLVIHAMKHDASTSTYLTESAYRGNSVRPRSMRQ